MKKIPILLLLLAITVWISACVQTTPNPDPTVEAISKEFIITLTAQAQSGNESSDNLEAVAAQATQAKVNLDSTQTAIAIEENIQAAATEQAAAPIIAELPLYHVDTEKGKVVWIHSPVEITVEGYHQFAYKNDYPAATVTNFVIAGDYEWQSTYSTSGCGFLLRANGDSIKPSQYAVAATRAGNGYIFFLAQVDGELVNYDYLYSNGIDPKFDSANGAKNRLAVVARGNLLDIYSNYTFVGTFDVLKPPQKPSLPPPPEQPSRPDIRQGDKDYDVLIEKYQQAVEQYRIALDQYQEVTDSINGFYSSLSRSFDNEKVLNSGFVGLVGLNESGKTTCSFTNTWLWEIQP